MSIPTLEMRDELVLDMAGLQAAKSSLDHGAVTPAFGPHHLEVVGGAATAAWKSGLRTGQRCCGSGLRVLRNTGINVMAASGHSY